MIRNSTGFAAVRHAGASLAVGVLAAVTLFVSPASAQQNLTSVDDCDFIFGDIDALDFQDSDETDGLTGYLVVFQHANSQVSVVTGGDTTICVAGLETNSNLTVTLDGATVLFNGPFSANATISGIQWNADLMAIASTFPNLTCGPHTLTATGVDDNGDAFTQSVNFQVTGCPNLPTAGTDTGRLVGLGGALVVLGAGIFYGVRQRRDQVAA